MVSEPRACHPRLGRLQPRPPCEGAAARRGSSSQAGGRPTANAAPAGRSPGGRSPARCQRPNRKGLLACGEAAGAAPARGQPAKGWRHRGRRLRRGNDSDSDGDGQRGQEG
ncbi:hypothetical protein GW17_00020881 [Ensete ventricosum]|nr:hypothetical protein GW17_00020881 [Ensete ventricosum]